MYHRSGAARLFGVAGRENIVGFYGAGIDTRVSEKAAEKKIPSCRGEGESALKIDVLESS